MKIELIPKEILDYYDVPLIFIAIDKNEIHYICLIIEDDPKYVSLQISIEKLGLCLSEEIDLRDIFINPEFNEYFLATWEGNILYAELKKGKIPEEFLPDQGFKFNKKK